MTKELLNISGKIDQPTIETYRAIAEETAELGIDYVVVGASARDLVLHYAYGIDITRATTDLDFAIEVEDWVTVECLKDNLVKRAFTESDATRRLISPTQIIVDLVPFGSIADEDQIIRWPPDNAFAMNVLGFPEACAHAVWVRIQEAPAIDIPVVSPEGLLLLKVISWSDRSRDSRRKDALDMRYLLNVYDRLPHKESGVYDSELLVEYDGDTQLVGAYLLGAKASAIANDATRSYVVSFMDDEHKDQLALEMGASGDDYDYTIRLIEVLLDGLERVKNADK